MTQVNYERLKELETLTLRQGTGKSLDERICVMQAVDYVTTGGLSDHPDCACSALTRYAITVNDRADDEQRQKLKPLILKLVGTRDGKTKERAEFLAHHSITVVLPLLVEQLGLTSEAEKLRGFKLGEWREMEDFCRSLNEPLRKAVKVKTADAVAHAAADAVAAVAYAAYAAADAAAAAAVAHAAADAADAAAADAAYAAAVAHAAAADWRSLRLRIWEAAFSGLEKACEIREARP
jgi:hypothetical protein